MTEDEAILLRRHIRSAHPNLLGGGPESMMAFSPLPNSGLSDVPAEWLVAIHEASHMGLYREHPDDHWRA